MHASLQSEWPAPRFRRAGQVLALTLLATLFTAEFLTPLGFAHGTLYSLPVLSAALSRNERYVAFIALAAVCLTVAGFFVSPAGYSLAPVLANRLLSILVVIITAAVSIVALRALADSLAVSRQLTDSLHDLQQSRQRLDTTLESITDGLCILDHTLCFSYVNSEAERLVKRSRDELIGHRLQDIFKESAALEQHLEEVMQAKQVRSFELFYEPLKAWFEFRAYPSSEGVTVYFYDKTSQVEVQLALRTSEERFRYLARATTDIIWDWDPHNNTLWWSDGIHETFGYGAEGNGTAQFWRSRIHPDDRERVISSLGKVISEGGSEWQSEYRFLRSDDSVAFVSDHGFVLRDETGKARRVVGGMSDVTERRMMQEQLQQSDRLRTIGELTGGIAHDFNNLLTVILSSSESLANALQDQEELLSLADMTQNAAQRGAQLTQRLLAFARRQPLEPRILDIRQLLDTMEKLLRRTLPASIDIELVHAGGLWPSLADPAQLESAILNLCFNARDAMPEGGKLTIETANMRLDEEYCALHGGGPTPGQYVMIAVSDTGTGIDPEQLKRVFDPFFTTKEKGEGTGLGLSMVYGFVKQSKGHIKIYSEPGEGTTVRVYLPRATAGEATCPPASSRPLTSGNEKILLVEDDDLVRQSVTMQLEHLGYEVISAADGETALNLLQSGTQADLLFTDVVMPGKLNGRQLAEEVKRRGWDMKILFTSGYTENAIVHQGRLDPGLQLLSKPYRQAELAQKLRQIFEKD